MRPELDATQLFEVMRRSAVDIGAPGRDDAAGFGLLNVPAALAYPAPVRDPFEPNDDIEFVQLGRPLRQLHPTADDAGEADGRPSGRGSTGSRTRATSTASGCPKNGRVTATLTADANVDLSLWKQGTRQRRRASSSATTGSPGRRSPERRSG